MVSTMSPTSLSRTRPNFNDKYEEYRKKWGGGIMGSKLRPRPRQRRGYLQTKLLKE